MMNECRHAYVQAIDGTTCLIQCPCRALDQGQYELLPDDNDNFDFSDDWLLFEFAPGDIVRTEQRSSESGETIAVACQLVRSGGNRNDLKRLLYRICSAKPSADTIFSEFSEDNVRQLMKHTDGATFVYPDVRTWITENATVLAEHLMQS